MEIKIFHRIILLFLFLPSISLAQENCDFYVSNRGNDTFPGTSKQLAKKTFAGIAPILKNFSIANLSITQGQYYRTTFVECILVMDKQQMKILIVDDEPDIREFISYNLIRKGYTVLTASDGKEGYDMALEFRPNLIILDILMPFLNGYETCMRLRQNPMFDDTKIIFLSALNESTAKDFGLELEADAFIGKPIRIELLMKRVDHWMKKAG